MIVKPRKKPLHLQKLQALLRRTPPKHLKYPLIKEQLAKSIAGYKGEQSMDYPLSFLAEKQYFIFHDLRLQLNQHYFQIDTLILSPFFFLILEIKNISGTIFFDQQFHQLIRTHNGYEESFPDPLLQIQRQQSQLEKWLVKQKVANIPVCSLIVISNPKTVIRTSSENRYLSKKVIRRDFLPLKVEQLESLYNNEALSINEMKKVIRHLKKHDTSYNPPILKQYQIMQEQLQKGVYCTKCNHLPMIRTQGTWFCSACHIKDKTAHIPALKDYLLLVKPTITNGETRKFLLMNNAAATTRLLRSLNITYSGTNKGRVYSLSFKEEDL
ncbi:nuclease-related domain-containing protein [Halalkalibacter nanhaiisediminis]|uniref:Nuclease-like protein n=1 Tax=Halalkalibacter nanhaiisediminis TaxID=688079 RepID=A0A562QSQ4_9BACI|nr:nuclease-related domain-containing protein [Halalkalibacter nanhaiisediminis]TWI59801.1 nuclease-like protein [Halalkalibacter nanhaiisediminis]